MLGKSVGEAEWWPLLRLEPVSCLVVRTASCQCHYQTIRCELAEGGRIPGRPVIQPASPTCFLAKNVAAPFLAASDNACHNFIPDCLSMSWLSHVRSKGVRSPQPPAGCPESQRSPVRPNSQIEKFLF